MNRETARSPLDVYDVCFEIKELTSDLTLQEFVDNRVLYLSIQRLLEIAGEAFNRAIRFTPDLVDSVPDGRQLIGLRNRIAHDYDNIKLEIIWETATVDLPVLRNQNSRAAGRRRPHLCRSWLTTIK